MYGVCILINTLKKALQISFYGLDLKCSPKVLGFGQGGNVDVSHGQWISALRSSLSTSLLEVKDLLEEFGGWVCVCFQSSLLKLILVKDTESEAVQECSIVFE